MKKVWGVLMVCALAFSANAFAASADEKALTQAVEEMRVAMVKSDKALLEKVGAPDLSYGHSSGKLENNEQFVDTIVSGRSVFVTLAFNDQTVQINGDVGVVRHILEAKTNDSGKPGEVKIGVLQVWKKLNGQWKLLARQAYKLPS